MVEKPETKEREKPSIGNPVSYMGSGSFVDTTIFVTVITRKLWIRETTFRLN